jgi:beta-phosphoglucomutase
MKKSVIFDMDGVVVNTEPVHYKSNQVFYKSLGITVADDVYASFTGNSDKNIIQKLKDIYNLDVEKEVLLNKCRDYFCEAFNSDETLDLMPGVKDLIIDLYNNGMVLLLASSSSRVQIEMVFNRFGLHKYFTHIISGEDFEYSKPNPAIFLDAVGKSGFTAAECIIIEDSTNGIKAATAAGVYCIGYKNDEHSLQDTSLANEVISDFKQLSYERIRDIK